MRALVQRVNRARVTVAGEEVGRIGRGLLVFVGVTHGDGESEAAWLAKRVAGLRVFEDAAGKMNVAVKEAGGSVLAVPQFTLYGDCRRGMRPDFAAAARPEEARGLFERFAAQVRAEGVLVATGAFREHMQVELENNGPVTLWIAREPGEAGGTPAAQ